MKKGWLFKLIIIVALLQHIYITHVNNRNLHILTQRIEVIDEFNKNLQGMRESK